MASNWKLTNRVWHANLGMMAAITLGIIALSCPFIAHGWEAGKFLMEIHYGKFLPPQTRWIWIDSQGFLLAFLVVSGVLMHRKSVKKAASTAADDPAVAGSSVTILSLGTDVPSLAFADAAEQIGLRAFRGQPEALKTLDLSQERWLVLTHGGQAEPAQAKDLTERVASFKKGSLKRLEFTVETGADEPLADLIEALTHAGAKAMRLAKGEAPWQNAVIEHLRSQSPTLKGQRSLPAKAAAPGSRNPTVRPSGFTLLEVLITVLIITGLITVTAGAFQSLARQDGVHEAAREFAQILREARQMAKRQNTLVRVALTTPMMVGVLSSYGQTEDDLRPGCGVYAFRVPAEQLEPVAFTQPTTAYESDASLRETVPLTRVPLPRSLIGGWTMAPGHAGWHRWGEHIWVGGPVIHEYLKGDVENYAKVMLHKPQTTWAETRHPDDRRVSPFSHYPPEMQRTPYRHPPRPVIKALAGEERVTLDDGTLIPAAEVWGASPILQWSDVSPDNDLPLAAIDFTPEGSLACTGLTEVEFHFRPGADRLPVYKVIIRAHNGEVRIE